MISRRKILSRSRDELNVDLGLEEDEDAWFTKERLFRDHIQEVLNKWEQIDDEIWAKIICMERNRRVAKAYARTPVLTVNGSADGFDGYKIGLNGFENPMRDPKTEEAKRHIGHGVKIKMDDAGNIIIKRASKNAVYAKDVNGSEDSCLSADIQRLQGQLEYEKPVKMFDMKKFQQHISRELRRAYPDRRKLETQCICVVGFVKDNTEVLDMPCWIMIINIVALDMLKSKLPPTVMSKRPSAPNLASIFERPLRNGHKNGVNDEDPYSLPGLTSRNSIYGVLGDPKPPKLPPRDIPRVPVPTPDYEDKDDERFDFPPAKHNNNNNNSVNNHSRNPSIYDDPYYCGLSARVPKFGKKVPAPHMPGLHTPLRKAHSGSYLSLIRPYDSGLESDGHTGSSEDDYSRIYGRLRQVPAHYGYYQRKELYASKWR
ncbi:dwarfin sma-2 [Nephila pilipes]|uniref:Dwarfin sma-2 n=1 Tax=Nephila pilipes TaxID=299642 RepID=A0A8X6PVV5_NEPPI|nr:dwarfin sma-2 [Nephila pilipes]